MCDNEYLAHQMIKDRLREAETRGALNSLVREFQQTQGSDAGREYPRRTWLALWWQAPAVWVAHLALPKIWNRL
jgi:hypothetical protein